MVVIQWPFLVGLDGEMKNRDTCLHDRYEARRIPIFLSDNVGAPETVLRATGTRDENRAVVDGNGQDLFIKWAIIWERWGILLIPERCRWGR